MRYNCTFMEVKVERFSCKYEAVIFAIKFSREEAFNHPSCNTKSCYSQTLLTRTLREP